MVLVIQRLTAAPRILKDLSATCRQRRQLPDERYRWQLSPVCMAVSQTLPISRTIRVFLCQQSDLSIFYAASKLLPKSLTGTVL